MSTMTHRPPAESVRDQRSEYDPLQREKARRARSARSAWTLLAPSLIILGVMLTMDVRSVPIELGSWVAIPDYHFSFKLVFDRLSVPLVILSFILCGTIGAFASRYLHRERGFNRFHVFYALFLLGMVATSLAGTIETLFTGWELVQATARVCAMNLMLHGIGSEASVPVRVADALAADPGERFQVVLANPPFGKKSSTLIVGEDGRSTTEKDIIERDDFWATTSNKQLNFVQHIKTLLDIHGRAAVVVPDNVLFEGGAGETIRRKLLHECELHTLLRLPTGLFYAQGVKANVIFFDKKPASETPWTKKLWIYDLRTNQHFTLKTNPMKVEDLMEFVKLYNSANRNDRKATWSPESPEGRWRAYDYAELAARDKASLDIFWLKDDSPADSDNLPPPDVIAQEIVDDLEAALEQFRLIAGDLVRDTKVDS